MKIEKISENQICCTLTLADLMNNKIHLGDLAGNSDRVRNFFNYLMQRAKRDCGFEFESGPLIIEAIFEIILKIRDEGTTILLVEQNANMALQIADYAYVLETGFISMTGTGEDLLENEDIIKAYLGG